MRLKSFLGFILLAVFAIALAACAANQPAAAPQTSVQSSPAPEVTAAGSSEIKRTELTQNAQFAAELKLAPETAQAEREAALTFTVKDRQGAAVKNLQVVHEKLMHLLVVSDDLATFDHVHPEQQADGTFRLAYKFPSGGRFKLYADFTPQNSSQIVNVFDVDVAGTVRERTPLVADAELKKTVDGITFNVKAQQPIKAGAGTMLDFYVSDAATGKPVTDLQPYLGAMAHFVVISEDATKFLHVHAMEGKKTETKGATGKTADTEHGAMEMEVEPGAESAAQPTVQAHTEFPTAGLYKLWGQFQRGGRVFTVPFVLNIAPGEAKSAEKTGIPKDATKITVGQSGFEPSSLTVKKGQPVKLAFLRKDAAGCGTEVVFSKLNIKKQLPVGETVLVEITPQESGELSFACGMDMLKGKILVQ
jgi:hypothetical protein